MILRFDENSHLEMNEKKLGKENRCNKKINNNNYFINKLKTVLKSN